MSRQHAAQGCRPRETERVAIPAQSGSDRQKSRGIAAADDGPNHEEIASSAPKGNLVQLA
jgi:hypothetical protein